MATIIEYKETVNNAYGTCTRLNVIVDGEFFRLLTAEWVSDIKTGQTPGTVYIKCGSNGFHVPGTVEGIRKQFKTSTGMSGPVYLA